MVKRLGGIFGRTFLINNVNSLCVHINCFDAINYISKSEKPHESFSVIKGSFPGLHYTCLKVTLVLLEEQQIKLEHFQFKNQRNPPFKPYVAYG